MSIRKISKISVVSVISLLYSLPSFADAPYEKYHVTCKEISKDVLKNTIGILTIYSGDNKGTQLRTYLRSGKQFTYNKSLEVKEETIPISAFGYHPPIDESCIGGRYPIVEKSARYLRIVYNPIKNLEAWFSIDDLEENFYTSIIMLDKIDTSSRFFVNIFCFTQSGKRKLYKEPKEDANFIIILKDEHKHSLLKIMEQKNDFVRIGILHVDFSTNKKSIEPIGWISIRDNRAMLTIWIEDADLC